MVTMVAMAEWSFLTNHARALLLIARDPDARLRDLAAALAVTERTAYGIVAGVYRRIDAGSPERVRHRLSLVHAEQRDLAEAGLACERLFAEAAASQIQAG